MASRRGGSPSSGWSWTVAAEAAVSRGGGDGFVSLLSVDSQTNPSIPGFRRRAARQRLNMRSGDASSQNHEFVLLVSPNRPLTYQTEPFKVKRNRLSGREEQTRRLRDDVTVPRRMASRAEGTVNKKTNKKTNKKKNTQAV
ncbi:Hypothetical predicted protein [Xyrichtys novacula]|uniref:Uncharacterized protein n=1 Tax=Xyrichtys novacula TaxID=13765 RepID=A0AAV1FKE7_XYRNO|nr:Hypothetical predicted protein [Xyrichtys novacula]